MTALCLLSTRNRCPPARRAFTLVELLVAVAILLVLAAIGWASMRDTLPRYRMVAAAKALRGDLMTLRNLAIQSGRETKLRLTGSPGDCAALDSWGGSWELAIGDRSDRSTAWDLLPEDSMVDGSDDDRSEASADLGPGGNRASRFVCLRQWGALEGPGPDTADAIVFSPRGWVANPGSDFGTQGTIDLTLVNQAAAAKGVTDEITLRVTRAGLVRLEPTLGGEAMGSAGTSTSSAAP